MTKISGSGLVNKARERPFQLACAWRLGKTKFKCKRVVRECKVQKDNLIRALDPGELEGQFRKPGSDVFASKIKTNKVNRIYNHRKNDGQQPTVFGAIAPTELCEKSDLYYSATETDRPRGEDECGTGRNNENLRDPDILASKEYTDLMGRYFGSVLVAGNETENQNFGNSVAGSSEGMVGVINYSSEAAGHFDIPDENNIFLKMEMTPLSRTDTAGIKDSITAPANAVTMPRVADDKQALAIAIATTIKQNENALECVVIQEQKAKALFNQYGLEMVQTSRDGNCFYDGVAKLHLYDADVNALREACYREGERCLNGQGKFAIADNLVEIYMEQLQALKNTGNYSEELDLRLMACVLDKEIIVCNLEGELLSHISAEGSPLTYCSGHRPLQELLADHDNQLMFVLDGCHYIASKKKR